MGEVFDSPEARSSTTMASKTPREVKTHFSTIDRYHESRSFKTLEGARAYAHRKVGAHPEYSSFGYVVSSYGDAKLTFSGATFEELFPREVKPAEDPEEYSEDLLEEINPRFNLAPPMELRAPEEDGIPF